MADSQLSSATSTLTDEAPLQLDNGHLEAEGELARGQALDGLTMNQMVVKLIDAVEPFALGGVAAPVLDAAERLVELIRQLRSPAGGWPDDVPQTPEMLLPYVVEEAYDVLNALQSSTVERVEKLESVDVVDRLLAQGYERVSTLGPWLLWAIARSAYDIMCLLEGVSARVFLPEQGWQTGQLRLVALLNMAIGEQTGRLDLTTHQAVGAMLPSDAMIQATDLELCREPSWVEGFLQGLTQHIQTTTPALSYFMTNVSVEALMPHHAWETGSMRLELGLEWTADRAQVVSIEKADNLAESIAPSPTNPVIRFTDEDWLKTYAATIARQQIASLWVCLPGVHEGGAIAASNTSDTDDIISVVNDACHIAAFLQTSPTVVSRNFPQRDWRLDELSLRLLWSISRSAYDVMPMLTGLQCSVLEPTRDWQTGVLRLLISLSIRTPELDWYVDLVTGELLPSPAENSTVLDDAVVQFHEQGWPQQPIRVQNLRDRMVEQINRMTPEIQLFMDGAGIDLRDADQRWQPGVIYFNANVEFIPHRSS